MHRSVCTLPLRTVDTHHPRRFHGRCTSTCTCTVRALAAHRAQALSGSSSTYGAQAQSGAGSSYDVRPPSAAPYTDAAAGFLDLEAFLLPCSDIPGSNRLQRRAEIRVPVQEADALRQRVAGVPLAVEQAFVEHLPFIRLCGRASARQCARQNARACTSFCQLCEMSSARAGRARAAPAGACRRAEGYAGIRCQEDAGSLSIMAMR
ncbi:hypothetical protein JB92DRAFT_2927174 [Gautieria morchelliformis]|nr:hypothetical protein JB92DRAFT_2927174 [Gautieria morchelliformis]